MQKYLTKCFEYVRISLQDNWRLFNPVISIPRSWIVRQEFCIFLLEGDIRMRNQN